MIKDPETGEWRKKTMHERYNKNRQVDRSQEQYIRKKSEKELKKAPKQLSRVFDRLYDCMIAFRVPIGHLFYYVIFLPLCNNMTSNWKPTKVI